MVQSWHSWSTSTHIQMSRLFPDKKRTLYGRVRYWNPDFFYGRIPSQAKGNGWPDGIPTKSRRIPYWNPDFFCAIIRKTNVRTFIGFIIPHSRELSSAGSSGECPRKTKERTCRDYPRKPSMNGLCSFTPKPGGEPTTSCAGSVFDPAGKAIRQ